MHIDSRPAEVRAQKRLDRIILTEGMGKSLNLEDR